jgi:mannose-6-phosphate isomerase-like protein (cupin superfamily)
VKRVESHEKKWGYEKWIVNEEYCGKLLTLKKMYRCSIHCHKIKSETFFVIKGKVLIEIDDKSFVLIEGDAIDIRRGEYHRFTGLEDSSIIEFSTHHEEDDSYRKVESGKVDNQAEIKEKILQALHDSDTNEGRIRVVFDFLQ